MYVKIVISAVLVSILPCESQHQRFFAVPFEDKSISEPPRLQQLNRFNHFDTEKHFNNGNLQSNLAQNNNFFLNPIVSNTEPQFNINQNQFNSNFENGQNTQQQFTLNQQTEMHGFVENQNPTSDFAQQIQASNGNNQQVLNSVTRPRGQPAQPINAFLSVEEPVLSFIAEPQSTPTTVNFQTQTHSPTNVAFHSQFPSATNHQQFPQQILLQTPQQFKPQFSHFVQPQVHQPIRSQVLSQIEQPQTHDHFSSHVSHQIQQPQIQPQTLSQFSQQVQPQHFQISPQIVQPTQKPRLQRPRNKQQRIIPSLQPPQQSEFIIKAQQPNHRFENQRNVASNLKVQSDSNIFQQETNRDTEEEIFRKQAASAKYSFASQIDDSINGNQHQREEVRDGLSVKGMYSYSDGYVKRTVFYEADEKGYRVIGEEEEPLGDGPQFNPKGQANVSSFVAGNAVQYSITSDDIPKRNPASQEATAI